MNQRKLPSISNLLIQTPEWNVSPPSPTPQWNQSPWTTDQKITTSAAPPSPMSLSPQWPKNNMLSPSPTQIRPCTPPHSEKSPGLLSIESFNSTVSPLLSPIPSPCSPSMNWSEQQLPPIHGDDPPRRLTTSPSPTFNNNNSFYRPIDPIKRLSTGTLDVPKPAVDTYLSVTQRQRSLSETNERPFEQESRKRSLSINDEPSTKRKRGRPPAVTPETEDQITFLTPTVWNIPVSKDQQEREKKASLKQTTEDHMHDSMTAFSSFDMDTVLHMPRKKRGRKPKTLIHGNSCFIWKDLTSTRSK